MKEFDVKSIQKLMKKENKKIHVTCILSFLNNVFNTFLYQAGSKEFQNSYSSPCHFALVLQLDKEG